MVLYGSAIRSEGNLRPDIGDLDLALEIQVVNNALLDDIKAAAMDQQWRTAVQRAGLDTHLMQGDDRITVAGSLLKVLTLFERQTRGLDVPEDGRKPCTYILWSLPGQLESELTEVPEGLSAEVQACSSEEVKFLTQLCEQTFTRQERAKHFYQALTH